MRRAAFTASFLFHAGVLCAAWVWRVNPPASHREDRGESAPDFSFFAAVSPAEAAPTEEIVAVVEFVPPPGQPAVRVEAGVDPIVSTAAEAIFATPSGIVSAMPVAAAKPSKRPSARSTGGLARGTGSGAKGGANYQPPRYHVCPAPPYPAAARTKKLEGAALLLVLVDAAGRPTKVTLRRSTGSSILDDAAIRAVWAWRFEPARTGGQAIAAAVEVPVRFRYRG